MTRRAPGSPRRRSRRAAIVVLLTAALLLSAACSSDDHGGGDAGPPLVAPVEGPALRSAGSQLLSPAGTLSPRPSLPTTQPTEAWVAPLAGSASAVRVEGDVVLAIDAAAESAEVVALDRATGAERWRSPLPAQGFFTGLAVVGDVVVVTGSARAPGAEQASAVATAVALADGAPRWQRSLVGFDAQAAPTPGGLVLAGLAESGAVVAASEVAVVDPATGQDVWSRTFDANPIGDGAGLAVGDQHLYVSDGTTLTALTTRTGDTTWTVDSPLVGAMTEVGDVVVLGAFTDVPDLRAVAIEDGDERWRSSVLDPTALAYTVATLDESLVAVTYDGGVGGTLVVDATDGKAVWDSAGRGVAAGLVGDGPTQVVTTDFGDAGVDVELVSLPDGAVVGSAQVTGDGQLLVADGAVAAVSNERVAAWSLTGQDRAGPRWDVALDDGSGPTFGPTPTQAVDGALVVGRGATLRWLG